MPNPAIEQAARLSVAPMMDWTGIHLNSIGSWALCALCVQLQIAFWRALLGVLRLNEFDPIAASLNEQNSYSPQDT